jgi:hypothetical protein
MGRERLGRRGAKKKLEAAVVFWAQGATAEKSDHSEALEDAELMGLPPEAIAELERLERQEEGGECFDLWDVNEPSLRWFLALSTQWRYSPMGEALGLDYPAAESAARMMGIQAPDCFGDLRAAERAILKHWRETRPRPRRRRRK